MEKSKSHGNTTGRGTSKIRPTTTTTMAAAG